MPPGDAMRGLSHINLKASPAQTRSSPCLTRRTWAVAFWGCYSADETYHKDMWALFAAGAARTSRLRLGPEVAGIILKDPTLIAQQIATLDELTAGRAE